MPRLAAVRGQGLWSTGTHAHWDVITRDEGGRRPLGLRARTDTRHPFAPPAPSDAREQERGGLAPTPPALTADTRRTQPGGPALRCLREPQLPATVSTGSDCEFHRTTLGPSMTSRNDQRDTCA